MLGSLFLSGIILAVAQPVAVQTANQTIVEDGADGMARAVNRMVGGIISYVRWPENPAAAARNLCIVGSPTLTASIAPSIAGGPPVTVHRLSPAAASVRKDCDILFLGRMAAADRQRLTGWVRGRAVLTISDDDPDCLHGAMFCLSARAGRLGFSVNLDAIGRGPLRVDPRVLKMGQNDGSAT